MKISSGKSITIIPSFSMDLPSMGRIGMLDHQGTAAGLWARSTRQRRRSRSPFDERPAKEAWDYEGGWVYYVCLFCCCRCFSWDYHPVVVSILLFVFTTENPQENLFTPWIHASLPPVAGRTCFIAITKLKGQGKWTKFEKSLALRSRSLSVILFQHMYAINVMAVMAHLSLSLRLGACSTYPYAALGDAFREPLGSTNGNLGQKHKGDPCPCREHFPVSQMDHYHTARAQGRHISKAQKWLQ